MDVYENLKNADIKIVEGVPPKGLYKPVCQFGNLLYISGQGSIENGELITGRAGETKTTAEAKDAARVCAVNMLALLHEYLGDLNKIKQVVKLLGFVACADDFTEQAQVMNGASEVFISAFGEDGRSARSAIGTNALPLGLTVEVEGLFELK